MKKNSRKDLVDFLKFELKNQSKISGGIALITLGIKIKSLIIDATVSNVDGGIIDPPLNPGGSGTRP